VPEAKVELKNVGLRYFGPDGETEALKDVSFAVAPGEFVAIIGPSGCGKSTLLSLISGLAAPTEGSVLVDGKPVTGPSRKVGYMLQQDYLFEWRTILENALLGAEIQGLPIAKARQRAAQLLTRYGLGQFLNHLPRQLSGGMRQRAALLRTLLIDTEVMLLDEPFGALDAQTKLAMQEWLLQLWSDFGKTVVFVTHDVEEAIFLSDTVHVMAARPGRIVESIAVPLPRPRHRAVAATREFIAVKERCLDLLRSHAVAVEDAA